MLSIERGSVLISAESQLSPHHFMSSTGHRRVQTRFPSCLHRRAERDIYHHHHTTSAEEFQVDDQGLRAMELRAYSDFNEYLMALSRIQISAKLVGKAKYLGRCTKTQGSCIVPAQCLKELQLKANISLGSRWFNMGSCFKTKAF
jgi:hypothetical protein